MPAGGPRMTDAERQALRRKRVKTRKKLEQHGVAPAPAALVARPVPGGFIHGGASPELLHQDAEVLLAAFLDDPGTPDYLRERSYVMALRDFFYIRARVLRYRSYVESMSLEESLGELEVIEERSEELSPGLLHKRTEIRRYMNAVRVLAGLEMLMDRKLSKLGLDPMSRFRMGKDVAAAKADLALIWAQQEADERGAG